MEKTLKTKVPTEWGFTGPILQGKGLYRVLVTDWLYPQIFKVGTEPTLLRLYAKYGVPRDTPVSLRSELTTSTNESEKGTGLNEGSERPVLRSSREGAVSQINS